MDQSLQFSGQMELGAYPESDAMYDHQTSTSDNLDDNQQYILPLQGQPDASTQYAEYDGMLSSYQKPNIQVTGDTDLSFKSSRQQVTFNMPGAFKEHNDDMDVDESPPFTIALDLFFDSTFEAAAPSYNTYVQKPSTAEPESIFKDHTVSDYNQDTHIFIPSTDTQTFVPSHDNQSIAPSHDNQSIAPSHDTQSIVPSNDHFDTNSLVPSQDERLHHSNSFVSMNNVYQSNGYNNQFISSNFEDNHLKSDPNSLMAQFENLQHHGANYYVNELSPLTTTTSLTPSVNSIHSTQPSFFSANQYFSRNSLDQSQSHRTSFDVYSKRRQSMDSQTSNNQNQGNQRYTSFTNSITNYIPFMNDKEKNSQRGNPPSTTSLPTSLFPNNHGNQQSKHLIRSIFKGNTSNNSANSPFLVQDELQQDQVNYLDGEETDNFLIGQHKDESETEVSDAHPNPKAKRSKRSLFTRFKTPVKIEPSDDIKLEDNEMDNNPLFNPARADNASSDNSVTGNFPVSRSPSGNLLGGSVLQNSTLNSSANGKQTPLQLQSEPDYAALFENMGKRKNIVNPSFIKTKPKAKNEAELNANTSTSNSNSNTEKSSILNVNISNENDRHLNVSISSSNASLMNGTDEGASNIIASTQNSNTATKSIASASKRILGSKLKPKKRTLKGPQQIDEQIEELIKTNSEESDDLSLSVATIITKGVEVEVDLKSLDLPPNTKIFPSSIINSKSRIRGRKENKEADMVDQSKIYLCNFCSRRFKRQEHLKRHFRSLHTFEKPYDCPICNKKFSRSDNLNQHLKIHKQEEEEQERLKLENEGLS